jgi:hypothetical protein
VSTTDSMPRYRVIAAELAFVGGTPYPRGSEVGCTNWPTGDLEPLNGSAKLIMAYWLRFQAHPFFPVSPYTAAHGFHLPSVLPRVAPPRKRYVGDPDGSELIDPVPEADATPAMPRYRPGKLRQIGNIPVKASDAVAFLDWPDDRLEPANPVAVSVAAYLAEHRDHPDRLSAPWCWHRASTYLPELAPVGKSGHAPQPLSRPRRQEPVCVACSRLPHHGARVGRDEHSPEVI